MMESLESRELLSTYYVSPHGKDHASGTSPRAAWKTIDRVNQQALKPGDLVLFQGGKKFQGSLYLPSREGGTDKKPVIFSNYGKGRATIYSGSRPGLDVAQTAGVAVTNLIFVGSGMTSNRTPGIYIHADHANKKLSYVHIRNVEVRKYGREGILITASGNNSSVSAVKVQNARLHDNLHGGLKGTGSKHHANKNWVVDHVQAYDNPGSRSAKGVTGSGIYLADVDNAVVQYSVASNNGRDGSAPVGIWSAGSNRVTFQYNESYGNKTRTISDGGGFDFDWDVSNSVMQYNYSHDNDGPGYLLYAGSHKSRGNVIRYNVSENDGRKNGKAGIQLGGDVQNALIHNNTVYFSTTGQSTSAALQAHDWGSNGKVPKNIQVRGNIFYTTGGANVLFLTDNVARNGSLSFAGNAYYSGGAKFNIQWGSKKFSSLASWRGNKGQEKLNGRATGFQGNPRLQGAGKGVTFGDADQLKTLAGYKLQKKSPLINRGEAHPTFLASIVKSDFYGDRALKGGRHDIGADEAR
ncbi:MAG TPA: right-handed parallel beta-helix repeat-containing protein [Tepidisphaeraceae bacterium]|nr:right-handed parallel beta-helix repeat-containing protein [Tepidisphaeraceae bacterium]